MHDRPYLAIVGAMLYLSTMSRPDIAYYLSVLCKFMSDPSPNCYSAAINVLLYVYKTRHRCISYSPQTFTPNALAAHRHDIDRNMGFHAYSDSSWGVPNPIFGYCLWLGGGPVSWCAKTAKSADSSCEAEYTACSKCSRDIAFVRLVLSDLGYPLHGRLVIAVDSTAAIRVAKNRGVTARNKHFDRELHFIRNEVDHQRTVLCHVHTRDQRADLFTKPLDKTTFYSHLNSFIRE